MKSLEKDRNRRYETATGFAADVHRYLAGEAVQAHPPSAAYRVRKFVRKHQVAIATASAFLGMLIASVGVSGALAVNARRARTIAEVRRIQAEANANEARANALQAKVNADSFWKAEEANVFGRIDTEIKNLSLQVDLDLIECRTDPRVGLLRLARPMPMIVGPVISLFPGTNNEIETTMSLVNRPRYRALGEFVTVAVLGMGQTFAPLLPPKPLIDDGQELQPWHVSTDGRRLLTLGGGRTIKLWDKATARPIATLRQGDEKAIAAGFSPDGATIYTHSWDGVVRFWEGEDGRFRAKTEARPDRLKLLGRVREDRLDEYDRGSWVNLLSNDRMITASMVEKKEDDFSSAARLRGPGRVVGFPDGAAHCPIGGSKAQAGHLPLLRGESMDQGRRPGSSCVDVLRCPRPTGRASRSRREDRPERPISGDEPWRGESGHDRLPG